MKYTGGRLNSQDIQQIQTKTMLDSQGKTTVAPEVLLTIARLTTLDVPGVSRMSPQPASVNRLFQRGAGEGVAIEIKEDVVTIDLHVILNQDVNIRDVSRQVQHEVARAISEMVGMQVGRINIHIEDIDYTASSNLEGSAEA
jgi:uncharacterized alkaline shock family protein YloU